jgi:hypothetical protein
MSGAATYIAFAICVGSPVHAPSASYNRDGSPIDAHQCDVMTWEDGGGDVLKGGVGHLDLKACLAKLGTMHERGNIVKFCALQPESPTEHAIVPRLHVEWNEGQ